MVKNIFLVTIKAYKYLSKMLPASCRYYPSCSEYAMWRFEFEKPHTAFAKSALRILRCNQLFEGGIEYPVVKFEGTRANAIFNSYQKYGTINTRFWLVPTQKDGLYYLVKDINAT